MIKIKQNEVLIGIILFFLIYNPPLIKYISFTVIAFFISVYMCVIKRRKVYKFFSNLHVRRIVLLLAVFSALWFFYACLLYILGGKLELFVTYIRYNMLMWMAFIVSCVVAGSFENSEDGFLCMLQSYIYAGSIQSVFAIISYFIPTVHDIFIKMMINYTSSERLARVIRQVSGFRCYGFAASIFDIFGFATAVLALIAYWMALRGSYKNIAFFILITFSALINARTSIVLLSIGCFIITLFKIRNVVVTKKYFFIIGSLFIIIVGVIIWLSLQSGSTASNSGWIGSGIREIEDFLFKGQYNGYFDALMNDFIFFPKELHSILFGAGLYPSDAIGKNSDIGYIQNIWLFGVLGSIFLYLIIIKIFIQSRKIMKKICVDYFMLSFALEVIFWVYMIKLNSIGYSQAAVVLWPVILFPYLSAIRNNEIDLK